MDLNKVISELDALANVGKVEEITPFLLKNLKVAENEGDVGAMLSILNELIGISREMCHHDDAMGYGSTALKLIKDASLEGSIYHATTMLNIANALRAAGHLEDSLSTYKQVEDLYRNLLNPDDFNYASLYNNESLLFQEMGQYKDAYERLKYALDIVVNAGDKEWEVAVTFANLANTAIELANTGGKDSESYNQKAIEYADKAIAAFDKMNSRGTHYAAAMVARGRIFEKRKEFSLAVSSYKSALDAVFNKFGKTDEYNRIREYLNSAIAKMDAFDFMANEYEEYQKAPVKVDSIFSEDNEKTYEKGMNICKEFFEEVGKPAIKEHFPDDYDKMAFGLVGEGSDCFGYDDEYSRDHDWGPGFCIWMSDEVYDLIGLKVQKLYDDLPSEYKGYTRITTPQGMVRLGVHRISDFYTHFIGASAFKEWIELGHVSNNTLMWIEEYQLAAATNGEVWEDKQGDFTKIREELAKYYDDSSVLLKLAQMSALFSQNLQYNYVRMRMRNDRVAVAFVLNDGLKQALRIAYLLNKKYAPHEKWLFKGAEDFEIVSKVSSFVEKITEADEHDRINKEDTALPIIEELALCLLSAMINKGYVGDMKLIDMEDGSLGTDLYLEHYTNEMVLRSDFMEQSKDELVGTIVQMEFAAFDEVVNEGGRASCQDDFETFNIMRSSQYNTWTMPMLVQYAVDFQGALERGWNMITEKYGRMEESTSPDEWAKIKDSFPVIPEGKKAIIEEIVKMQVKWMEDFAKEYPGLAKNARRIHTSEDAPWDTSYETYLRGELSTYSDKMLKMYGEFVVGVTKTGGNLAYKIMEETIHYYGYNSFEDAMDGMK